MSRTDPSCGSRSPSITRSRVVLPEPLGPMMPRKSPGSTGRLIPSSTAPSPYHQPGEPHEEDHDEDHGGEGHSRGPVPALLDGEVDGDDGERGGARHVTARGPEGFAARSRTSHHVLGGLLHDRRSEEHDHHQPPALFRLGRDGKEEKGGGGKAFPGGEDVYPGEEGDYVRCPVRHDLVVERRVTWQEPHDEDKDAQPHEERGAPNGKTPPAVRMRLHDF